jgi:hypothetical protein
MSRESSNVHDCFRPREVRSRLHSLRGATQRGLNPGGLRVLQVSRGRRPPISAVFSPSVPPGAPGDPAVSAWESSAGAPASPAATALCSAP